MKRKLFIYSMLFLLPGAWAMNEDEYSSNSNEPTSPTSFPFSSNYVDSANRDTAWSSDSEAAEMDSVDQSAENNAIQSSVSSPKVLGNIDSWVHRLLFGDINNNNHEFVFLDLSSQEKIELQNLPAASKSTIFNKAYTEVSSKKHKLQSPGVTPNDATQKKIERLTQFETKLTNLKKSLTPPSPYADALLQEMRDRMQNIEWIMTEEDFQKMKEIMKLKEYVNLSDIMRDVRQQLAFQLIKMPYFPEQRKLLGHLSKYLEETRQELVDVDYQWQFPEAGDILDMPMSSAQHESNAKKQQALMNAVEEGRIREEKEELDRQEKARQEQEKALKKEKHREEKESWKIERPQIKMERDQLAASLEEEKEKNRALEIQNTRIQDTKVQLMEMLNQRPEIDQQKPRINQ